MPNNALLPLIASLKKTQTKSKKSSRPKCPQKSESRLLVSPSRNRFAIEEERLMEVQPRSTIFEYHLLSHRNLSKGFSMECSQPTILKIGRRQQTLQISLFIRDGLILEAGTRELKIFQSGKDVKVLLKCSRHSKIKRGTL